MSKSKTWNDRIKDSRTKQYPWFHKITAFIADEFPAIAHRDASTTSTMEAFAVGLIYGRAGPEEGYRHLQAIDGIMRLTDKDDSVNSTRKILLDYLILHGFYAWPRGKARRKPFSKAEKEARLREAGWVERPARAVASYVRGVPVAPNTQLMWFQPDNGKPDHYSHYSGVLLAQAWKIYLAETERG